MLKNYKALLIIVGILVLIIGGSVLLVKSSNAPGQFDSFAQCIKDKGATFYGAFWCPHCRDQKKIFGKSEKLLPYVECSTPDGNSQLPVCTEKGIEGYPTWIFANGEKVSGQLSFDELAEKTSCTKP